MSTTTFHVDDDLAAYALDALEPDERAAVERHLAACERCRTELAAFGEAAAGIALTLNPIAPPPELRSRVISAVAAEANHAPTPSLIPLAANRTDGSRPARGKWSNRFASPAILLAAMLVLALGIVVGRTTSGGGLSPQAQYQQLLGKAASGGSKITVLQDAHGSSVPMAIATRATHASLIVGPVPSPPRGHVYQLWLLNQGGKPRSGGVFSATVQSAKVVRLAVSASSYASAAVTVEPGPGGSAQPTTPILMSADLKPPVGKA